jgi:hypothetical protein
LWIDPKTDAWSECKHRGRRQSAQNLVDPLEFLHIVRIDQHVVSQTKENLSMCFHGRVEDDMRIESTLDGMNDL